MSRLSRLGQVALVGGCLALLSACKHAPSLTDNMPLPVTETTLGIGDTIDVKVFGESDLSGTYRVGAEGAVQFPLIGSIKVDGLEPQQAAKAIEDKLHEGILRNPQVSVLLKEQTSKKVIVLGQVGKPGTYGFTPSMTLVEAITVAGGFTQLSSKNGTTLTRTVDGKKITQKIAAGDISEGKASNVFLRPGDIISVPERLF